MYFRSSGKLWVQIALVAWVCFVPFALGEWSHIEYGAGNYGADGKVDGRERGRSPEQYRRLFERLDALVASGGSEGTFYVNDINPEWATFAGERLLQYAHSKGWRKVNIRVVPGDFSEIPLPITDTAHLANPEFWFFDGGKESRTRNVNLVRRLASRSRNGLEITTWARAPMNRLRNFGRFQWAEQPVEVPGYIFPDGQPLPESFTGGQPHKRYRLAPPADAAYFDRGEIFGLSLVEAIPRYLSKCPYLALAAN